MSKRKPIRLYLFLAMLCLLSFSTSHPAFAAKSDLAAQAAHSEGDAGANSHDLVQGSHVEGHIAFLKAELGITPQQEQLWGPVAAAMREDVRTLDDAENRVSQNAAPNNAIEYLQNRVLFANLRAQGEQRFLNAFQPLYNSLSTQQKRVADSLLIPSEPE